MDRIALALVLSNLLKNRPRLARDALVGMLPARRRHAAGPAIGHAIRLGLVKEVRLEGAAYLELDPDMIGEAARIAGAPDTSSKAYRSAAAAIPRSHSKPFHVSHGEHEVHGHSSVYAFCYSVKDREEVSCFVIDAKGGKRRILLGRLDDGESLISRFLAGIDRAFGKRRFTREEIKHSLPTSLTGNNQPTKAAVEYLCYAGYLIRSDYAKGPSKFEREKKPNPAAPSGGATAAPGGGGRREGEHPFYG